MEENELLNYFTKENKSGYRTIESNLKKYNNILHQDIINWNINQEISFKEKIYRYIYKINELPKCKICGKLVKFTDSLIYGYREYCCRECSGSSIERQNNAKESYNKKYGYDNPFKVPEILEQIKQTNINKYGVENPFSSDEVKKQIKKTNLDKYGTEYTTLVDKVKEKSKITVLKKYNVTHFSKTKEFKIKFKTTTINNFGVDNPLKSKIIKEKRKKNCDSKLYLRFIAKGYEIIKFNYTDNTLTIKHPDGHIFIENRSFLINRFNTNTELSTVLLPKYASKGEESLYEYIFSLLGDNVLRNKRKILNGLELDIYINPNNLALEYNGLYWHSNIYKDKNYHIQKLEQCNKLGIELIQIFEDEWEYKRDIMKNIINNKLEINNRINSNDCLLCEIDIESSNKFIQENYIFSTFNDNVRFGLIHNNELVSVMLFKKNYDNSELLCFCEKLNTHIVGGSEKILKHFIHLYKPKIITTFVDRRFSQGSIYESLGFLFIENTEPNYYYFAPNELIRQASINFSKEILVKEGFDPNKTEFEIMEERGYLRIYDCGHMKFELKLE